MAGRRRIRPTAPACVLATLLVWVAPAAAQRIAPLQQQRRTPVVQVFQAAKDAVVNISTTRVVGTMGGMLGSEDLLDEVFELPFQRKVPVQSLGSGFVIHPAGYIVTNEHVIRRAEKVTVTLADGRNCPAQVISADPEHDLAVLKIDPPDGHRMPALTLGRSDDLLIGETVVAIGNPLGYAHTVTSGLISAMDRELDFGRGVTFRNLIQTDAGINPGSSGGPLLNINAEVIGINSAIRADAQGIGFAIPIHVLTDDLPRLLDFERLHRVVLGMEVRQVYAAQDDPAGPGRAYVAVAKVHPDSPAERAGLRAGQVFLSLDSQPLESLTDYCVLMLSKRPGQHLSCLVAQRGPGGQGSLTHQLDVVLDERPRPDGPALALRHFGLGVRELTPELARQLRLPSERGLLVAQVSEGGPARRSGLQSGDVLFQLGRQYVLTLEDLGRVLEDVEPGQILRVGILRGRHRAWGRIQASTRQDQP